MSSGSAPFTLHLLGSPRVEGLNGTAELPLGKPLALLCYLALEPSGVRRSDLARMLWPSSPESRAKASIRQALWLIRKETDGDIVREEQGELTLDDTVVQTDLAALGGDLARGDLAEALERWNGGPLSGFSVPDARPWLAWADTVRGRWESQVGQAVEDRAAAAEGHERADWLRRAVEVRPYRVEAWLALVQTLVDLRDAEGADEAMLQLRQVADEDDIELVGEAERRIRLLRRTAYGDPGERLVPEFVGRSEEFSALMQAWRSALSGRSRVVGIVGEAGTGKTALAAETLRYAEVDEGQTLEVRAVRAEAGLDLGVVGSVVADLIRRPGAAGTSPGSAQALRSLVPSEGDAVAPVPQSTTLADALADLLDAVSHEAPVLLVVDDAHWIDEASAIVLLRAARLLRGSRVLMVWTCRPGEHGTPNRGLTALRSAVEEGSGAVVELGPLTQSEVRELVALLLPDSDPEVLANLATRIHVASGGSPFHIVEILQVLRGQGLLGLDEDGLWLLAEDTSAEAVELPSSLPDALALRIEELSDQARRVGAELAVEGGPREPSALQRSGELSRTEVEAAVRTLLDRGLVRWTRDDRLELAHEKLAEAFRARASDATRGAVRPHWGRWMIAATAVSIAAAALFLLRPRSAPAPHFGGGTLWVMEGRQWVGHRFRGGNDPWERVDSIRIPDGVQSLNPRERIRLPDGTWDVVIAGYSASDQEEAPDAILVRNGQVDTVYSSPGDDALKLIGPDGRTALLHVENPDSSRYRSMLVRVDLWGRRDTTVLSAGETGSHALDWSPDGRILAVRIDAPWDTLALISPSGRRLATLPSPGPHLRDAVPCGRDTYLLSSIPAAELTRHDLWRRSTGELTRFRPRYVPHQPPVCSPDGSAFAYVTGDGDGGGRLVVQDLEGVVLSNGPVVPRRTPLLWIPERVGAPGRVEIIAADDTLDRGSRSTPVARVYNASDRVMEREVRWESAQPEIASVNADGTVTGNRPGQATLRAVVDDWLRDSVSIQVVAAPGDTAVLALADSFPSIDTTRWIVLGDPPPAALFDDDARPALDLTGDGRYSDGIASWEEFAVPGGATLEATFRLTEFARPDRNRIVVCLVDGDPPPRPGVFSDWTLRQEACVIWPAASGPADIDTTAITLSSAGQPVGAVPIGSRLRSGRWERLGVQLRADGRFSVTVNDTVVAVHPLGVANQPDTRWRMVVRGAGVDTRLLLRDVTLWREERYGVLEEPPNDGPAGGGPP